VDQPFVVRPAVPDAAHVASPLLTAADHKRLTAIAVPSRRASYATGRVLLHELVAEVSGQPADAVVVTSRCPRCGSDEHGRPHTSVDGLHVSLGHAPGVVLATVAWRPCGVDVERLEDADRLANAARVVLSPTEIRRGSGADPTALLRTWVRKESLLKAWGSGLQVRPEDLTLSDDDSSTTRPVDAPAGLPPAEIHDLVGGHVQRTDLVAAVCLLGGPHRPPAPTAPSASR
jgi:phosphopantetheinyl transferase